jgi:hypothetical protein
VDVVVSFGEINDEHGTGPLVKRLFRGRRGIFSVRSGDDWGIHDFGDWNVRLSLRRSTREECFREVVRLFRGMKVRTVTTVPFTTTEIFVTLALQEVYGAKTCVWIKDDQNVAVNNIPDGAMRECLEKCTLRLGTHPELCIAYEQKYGLPMSILPAVVPAHLVVGDQVPANCDVKARKGMLLGSFWDQSWFDRLCSAFENSTVNVDWYGQCRSPWLRFPPEKLAAARIVPFGVVPEAVLASKLREYPFVIVPVGTLDDKETNKGVASLSLPGRILFAAATSNTPVLVIGSTETCGARFVKHFGIGLVAPYEVRAIREAIDHITDPQFQLGARRNAAVIGPTVSDKGVVEWLQSSIELGKPADERFERAFATYRAAGCDGTDG